MRSLVVSAASGIIGQHREAIHGDQIVFTSNIRLARPFAGSGRRCDVCFEGADIGPSKQVKHTDFVRGDS